MIEIRPAAWPADLSTVRQLFTEYVASLGIDLSFQGVEAELAALPGKYAPPRGLVLVAWRGDEPQGCGAFRPIDDARCEMKRLYVRPTARGEQLGLRLAERLCAEARQAGYGQICLDTLATMTAAQALYRRLGFVPIEPYVFNPIEGTQYLARDL